MDRSNDKTGEMSAQTSQQRCLQESSDQLAMPATFSGLTPTAAIEAAVIAVRAHFALEVPVDTEDGVRLLIDAMRNAGAIPNSLRVDIEPRQALTTNRLTIHLGDYSLQTVGEELDQFLEKVFSLSKVIALELGIESASVESKRISMVLDGKLPDKVAGCQSIAKRRPNYSVFQKD